VPFRALCTLLCPFALWSGRRNLQAQSAALSGRVALSACEHCRVPAWHRAMHGVLHAAWCGRGCGATQRSGLSRAAAAGPSGCCATARTRSSRTATRPRRCAPHRTVQRAHVVMQRAYLPGAAPRSGGARTEWACVPRVLVPLRRTARWRCDGTPGHVYVPGVLRIVDRRDSHEQIAQARQRGRGAGRTRSHTHVRAHTHTHACSRARTHTHTDARAHAILLQAGSKFSKTTFQSKDSNALIDVNDSKCATACNRQHGDVRPLQHATDSVQQAQHCRQLRPLQHATWNRRGAKLATCGAPHLYPMLLSTAHTVAHSRHVSTSTGHASGTLAPGLCSPVQHLRQGWAPPPTPAPGLWALARLLLHGYSGVPRGTQPRLGAGFGRRSCRR
jgi:hypothetical protein